MSLRFVFVLQAITWIYSEYSQAHFLFKPLQFWLRYTLFFLTIWVHWFPQMLFHYIFWLFFSITLIFFPRSKSWSDMSAFTCHLWRMPPPLLPLSCGPCRCDNRTRALGNWLLINQANLTNNQTSVLINDTNRPRQMHRTRQRVQRLNAWASDFQTMPNVLLTNPTHPGEGWLQPNQRLQGKKTISYRGIEFRALTSSYGKHCTRTPAIFSQ